MANISHIVITGMGRSGSTLLLSLMQAFKEADVWLNECSPIDYKTGVPIKHPKFDYFNQILPLTITKRPEDIHNIDRFQSTFSNPIGFIALTRDPRDVIVSKLFNKYWVNGGRCKAFF